MIRYQERDQKCQMLRNGHLGKNVFDSSFYFKINYINKNRKALKAMRGFLKVQSTGYLEFLYHSTRIYEAFSELLCESRA